MSDPGRNSRVSRLDEESWDEALIGAARLLDPADTASQIFLEERFDIRSTASQREPERVVRTRQMGVNVRRNRPHRVAVHLHDPSTEDLLGLAGASRSARRTPGTGSEGGRDASVAGDESAASWRVCSGAVEAAQGHAMAGETIAVRADFVGVDQSVRIARPGRPVAKDRRAGYRLRLEVRIVAGGQMGSAVGDLVCGPDREFRSDTFAAEVVSRARQRFGAERPRAGTIPAVFAPGAGGILIHEIVGHALEADTVMRRSSLLAAQEGRVASEAVRVLDDPRRGRVAWRVDDDGENARPTPLIEGGVVVGKIHDLDTAIACGEAPTGHGRRAGYQEDVLPRLGCTFLAAGRVRPAAVIEDIESGVYVRRLEAATARTDTGVAMFIVSDADLVVRGRILAPLQPFIMSVTSLRALATLDGIGDDLAFDRCIGSCLRDGQPMVTTVGAPTFRIGLIRVVA